jgi:hypothetical protein
MFEHLRSLAAVACWVVAAYMGWYTLASTLVPWLSKGNSLFGLGLRGSLRWLSGTVVTLGLVWLGVRLWG